MKKPIKYLFVHLPVMTLMLVCYSLTNSASSQALCPVTLTGIPSGDIHNVCLNSVYFYAVEGAIAPPPYGFPPIPGSASYTWNISSGGSLAPGYSPGPGLIYYPIQWTVPGQHTLTITGSNCSTQKVITINVSNSPTPNQPSQISGPTEACTGNSTFSVIQELGMTYEWLLKKDGFSDTTTPVTVNGNEATISFSNSGNYQVQVYASNGNCVSTLASGLLVQVGTPKQFTFYGQYSDCVGVSSNYYIGQYDNTLTYNWSLPNGGGSIVNNGDHATVTWSSQGNYPLSLTASNACGAGPASTQTISPVPPLPLITSEIIGPNGPCTGISQLYTIESIPFVNYYWSTNANYGDVTISNANTPYPTIKFNTSGTFIIKARLSNSCNSIEKNLTVNVSSNSSLLDPPILFAPLNSCVNQPSEFSAVSPPPNEGSFSWIILPSEPTITPTSGSGHHSIVEITVPTERSYTVYANYTTNSSGCTSPSAQKETYFDEPPIVSISSVGPTTFCQGESVVLNAQGGDVVNWSNGATSQSITVTSSGSYWVTVSQSTGCSATSQPIDVTVNQLPSSVITPSGSTTLCSGEAVTLTASSNASYLWSTGATTQSIVVSSPGNYFVTVTSSDGCAATSSPTEIFVNPVPTATITPSGSTTIFAIESVTLTSSSGSSYLWSNGATTQAINVSTGGEYFVTVTDTNGCTAASVATSVTVLPIPSNNLGAGEVHSLFTYANDCYNGSVFPVGSNTGGRLGIGPNPPKVNTPVSSVFGIQGIIQVSAGYNHSLFLKNDGTVWATGVNNYGQLGDGTNQNKLYPVQIGSLANVIKVSAGAQFSLFLKADGTVWACGYNTHGNLGIGSTSNTNIPVQVIGLAGVKSISAGAGHSLFLMSDNSVRVCGTQSYGQFGNGTISSTATTTIPSSISNVIGISAGYGISYFIKSDSTVWAAGANDFGQLGDGTYVSKRSLPVQSIGLTSILSVSAGYQHAIYLRNDGSVFVSGRNNAGQLGIGSGIQRVSIPTLINSLASIQEVSAGWYHSLFMDEAYKVWATGGNGNGQLGIGTYTLIRTPDFVLDLNPCGSAQARKGASVIEENISFDTSEEVSLSEIFPNPADRELNVVLAEHAQSHIEVTLAELTGKILAARSIEKGDNKTTIVTENIPDGIYILAILSDSRKKYLKVIVRHSK